MSKEKKKVILITGASSGIGKATASQLLNEGHIVYGAARRVEQMKELEEQGGKVIRLDITNFDDITNCVNQIIKDQGRIDVLFNNAGYALYGSIEDVPIEEAKRQFEVNIFGLARMTQEVLPHMREQKSGTILNTSSAGGKIYSPFGAWYHATKHALEGWSDCLRIEVADFGVKVIVIEPGLIETEIIDVIGQGFTKLKPTGAYDQKYQAFRERRKNSKVRYSPPTVIAKTVSKAIRAQNPKTRYVAGNMGKRLIRMRKLLGDKGFDRLVKRMIE